MGKALVLWWQRAFACLLLLCCSAAWAAPEADTALWEVQKNGKTVGHLAGTMHVGRAQDALPAGFEDALAQADLLAVEMRVVEPASMTQDELLAQLARIEPLMRSEHTLNRSLGEARVQRIGQVLAQFGQTDSAVDGEARLAPWVVLVGLMTGVLPPDYHALFGVDRRVLQGAVEQGKPAVDLDAPEVSAVFGRLPEQTLLNSIDALLDNPQTAMQQIASLGEAYRLGDMRRVWHESQAENDPLLAKMSAQDRQVWHEFTANTVLRERNLAWLPKIEQHFQQQPTMVAVGVLHLFGEHGLIKLLRDKGYTVRPVQGV